MAVKGNLGGSIAFFVLAQTGGNKWAEIRTETSDADNEPCTSRAASITMTRSIDLAACRELLDGDQPMDEVERLLLKLAVRHGGEPRRCVEYKKMAFAAIIEAGSIDAAIETLSRVRHRLQHHHGLPQRNASSRAL